MYVLFFFFFQAEDGIRDLVRSRGLGDVYKRQGPSSAWKVGKAMTPMTMEAPDDYTLKLGFAEPYLSLIHI